MPTERKPLEVEDVSWDVSEGYALIARRHAIPRWFEAHVRIGSALVQLEIEIDESGATRCREVRVQTDTARARELNQPLLGEDDTEITGEDLRHIPLARLKRAAVAAAMNKVGEQPDSSLVPLVTTQSDREDFYRDFAAGMRSPRRGSPLTVEHLGRVAKLYRAAIGEGDPPTQTIADALNVSRSTAAKWVMKARERGFLGPALPGRAGEAVQDEEAS